MDVLGDVLTVLNVEAVVYYRATFSGPFSVAMPAESRHIRFHLGCRGKAWIGLPGGENAVIGAGDLVLIPHGSAHILADGQKTPTVPLEDMLKQARSERVGCIAYGGNGRDVEVLCGHFAYREEIAHPFIASLPPLIHIKAHEQQDYAWLKVVFQQVDKERRLGLPGHQEVLRRLSEVVFIQIIRAFAQKGA